MHIRSSAVRSAAAALAAGTVLASLSGCSSITIRDSSWPDVTSMQRSAEAVQVPSLVAEDAEDIRLRVDQLQTGVQIAWTSATGVTRDDCRRGSLSGTSAVGAAWWPTTRPAEGWTCGWWKVFEQDGTYYAWDGREATEQGD